MTLEIVIPTGEIVPLAEPAKVAQALESLRLLEARIRDAKTELTNALLAHSMEIGSRTIMLGGGQKATIKGGSETVYDAEMIMEELRAAGCPESRILEIVTETVSYRVNAVEARRASAANPQYATIIEQHSRKEERRASVSISR